MEILLGGWLIIDCNKVFTSLGSTTEFSSCRQLAEPQAKPKTKEANACACTVVNSNDFVEEDVVMLSTKSVKEIIVTSGIKEGKRNDEAFVSSFAERLVHAATVPAATASSRE